MSSHDALPPPSYRPEIDGLRALAVVAVVLFHARVPGFAGGFVGVDVFFVISGFLITGLILPQIRGGQFTLREFYQRRVRRLFPALFAVLLVSMPLAYWLLLPEELEDFGQSLLATALFVSNFLFYSEAGYFAGPAEAKPLLHTWSLAVEEQYYLLFPLLLLALRRWLPRYLLVTLVLLVLSLLLSQWSVRNAPVAGFYLLPSRMWELLLGSMLAMWPALGVVARWGREVCAAIGLLLIVLAVVRFDATTEFPGVAALVPCLGAALIIVGGGHTLVGRVLSLRGLVFIGLISYSLYLWHWPLLVFARHYLVAELSAAQTLLVLTVSVLAAVVSWRCVEQPFRGAQGWLTTTQLFRGAGFAMILFVAVGLIFDETEGLPTRLPAPVAEIAAVGEDKPAERKRCEGIVPEQVSFKRLCRITDSQVTPSFVFWGDSHASAVMRAVRPAAQTLGINGLNASSNGCPPFLGLSNQLVPECAAFHAQVLRVLQAHPELTTVVLLARWSRYLDPLPFGRENGEPIYLLEGAERAEDEAQNLALMRRAGQRTVDTLVAMGRRVILLGPIPEVGLDAPSLMAKARWRDRAFATITPRAVFDERQTQALSLLASLAREHEAAQFEPVHALFCDAAECAFAAEGLPLYFDEDHLAGNGAARFVPLFTRLLAP